MITDTELERIERLAEEATPGPWTTEKPAQAPGEVFANGVIIAAVARGQGIYSDPPGGSFPESDRRFIAASREAIPSLISSVRELRARAEAAEAENERLRGALRPFSDMAGELFARNWNAGDVVSAFDNPNDPHRLTAGDFFAARLALENTNG